MNDVLKRKLGVSQVSRQPGGVSVEAVLRKTMPRDADAVLSMDLSVLSFASALRDRSQVLAELPDNALLYLLEDDEGARGLAVLDPALVAGIVEFQVSGRVSQADPEARAPTRTDGIVVSEIFDKWLATADTALAEAGLVASWPINGFERAQRSLTGRDAALLLEPGELRCIDVILSLEGGAKTGRLSLAAPRRVPSVQGQGAATTAARLRGRLPDMQVGLRAVLVRLPHAVDAVRRLRPDQVLDLPDGCLQHVRLETRDGRLIREVHLGQLDGKKALRLLGAPASGSARLLPQPSQPDAALIAAPQAEPDLPDLPQLPDADAPDIAGAATPDLPGVPDLPELPDLADLPDLPDLPELPDLPDLPPLD